MGIGGTVTLVNGSPFDWTVANSHAYQMDVWNWPTIPAGESRQINVEWGVNGVITDDAGEVLYGLSGTDQTFQLDARNLQGAPNFDFHIYVTLNNLETRHNKKGDRIDEGWRTNTNINWILSQDSKGDFWSNSAPPVDWMQKSLPTIGNRKLKHVCMPGSHDAGMSEYHPGTFGASYWNTQTQLLDMYNQLIHGSRYFDLRPVISRGAFVTGHYSEFQNKWFGGNGQSMDGIIKAINDFTTTNKELIILSLSHTLDTDNDFRDLSQDQWNKLFDQLKGIKDLFVSPTFGGNSDLTDLRMNDFIGGNKAIVLIVADLPGGISLGSYASQGFYSRANFPLFDSYSDSKDAAFMQSDQLRKLTEQRKIVPDAGARKDAFHVLSWTLTQDNPITGDAIVNLAVSVYDPLFSNAFSAFTPESFPNVLYMDAYGCRDRAAENPAADRPKSVPAFPDVYALAMAVNNGVAGRNAYVVGA